MSLISQGRRRVVTVFGTRPEAIKMFPVVHALQQETGLETLVCVTAQHREILDQVLQIAQIVPDFDLNVMQPNQSLDTLLASLVTGLGQTFDQIKPHRILVHGDTLTTMAATLAAYFRKIPVGHVEAGLRSGDIYQPWPEEVNRKVTGVIADMHFAPTATAARALLAENVPESAIHITGNTVIDALLATQQRIRQQPALAQALDPLMAKLAGKRIVAVTSHRRENFGDGMEAIAQSIATISEREDVAIIFPVHPNPNVRGVMAERLGHRPNVYLIDPLDYPNFVRLLDLCELVLTDSGGVQEEAPSLGKPVLVMRETTERPEGVEAGTALLVGTQADRVISNVFTLLDDRQAYTAMARAHNPFGDGTAARKIARIVASEC